MKILFLANRLPHQQVAGGHKLIYQRMQALAERGHEIGLACFVEPGCEAYIPEVQKSVIELETVPTNRRIVIKRAMRDYVSRTLPAIYWKNYSRELMRKIGDMVERTSYDVVIAEFSEMGMYLYRNPYLSAVRKVVSCHRILTTAFSKYMDTKELDFSVRLKSAQQLHRLEAYEFEMYSAMDHILTLTPEDRFTLINTDPELRVSIIPPGIDHEYLNAEETWHEKEPIIMMSGYYADKANTDAALWFAKNVWSSIEKEHPELRFYIVGAGAGPKLLQLQKNPSILVTGEVDDMRPYRTRARLMVNPVRLGSGLRLKVLEAMASETPVVSSSLGLAGVPAQNGVNCFVADTPEMMQQSIEWLLTDKELAKMISHNARKMVLDRYTLETTTERLEQVLSDVVKM